VPKTILALLVALAPALVGGQAMESLSGDSLPHSSTALSGGALICSQPQALRIL
jgi:hypothetical protein